MTKLRLKIGPAVIEIHADDAPADTLQPNFVPFMDTGQEPSDLTIRVRLDPPPPKDGAPLVGESLGHWQLYAWQKGYRLEVLEQIHFQTRQVALISPALDHVECYLRPPTYRVPLHFQKGWCLAELMYPLIQWWLTLWAALRQKGMILHGSAVALEGGALAFFGPSGSGKTTIARLFRDEVGATILNDESIFICPQERGFDVIGTPWHGELPEVSPLRLPLYGLLSLEQAQANRWIPFTSMQVFRQVLSQAFLPLWNAKAMSGLIEVCEQLWTEVPSGQLQFVKDPSIVVYLMDMLDESRTQCELGIAAGEG